MRFVDLFAGLGGFHVALRRLGYGCVFACEIEPQLKALYEKNFGLQAAGDIRYIDLDAIPKHDILCAGFPCQPFSKAGNQEGFQCLRNGTLFDKVVEILDARKPEYLILENVPNLLRHDKERTWLGMRQRLEAVGYQVDDHRLSPHQFGIPQIRDRVYIVGCRSGLGEFTWPQPTPKSEMSIVSALDKHPPDARRLTPQVVDCLNVWQRFIELYPKDIYLPTFPVWSMEFGATYPYEDKTPHKAGLRALCWCKGSHGASLRDLPADRRMLGLPSHARVAQDRFPDWKIEFIRQNRADLCQQPQVDRPLAARDSAVSIQPPEARMELQGRGPQHLAVCYPVSCIGRAGKASHQLSLAHCDDKHPGPDHRLAAPVHDAPGMRPPPELARA